MEDNTHPKFSGPLPYTQALSLLRWAVQVPWEPRTSACFNSDEAHVYTLHSLKVALLSASAQLRLPEESIRQQGHHRINSVQLYSRDDTIESLWVQAQIAAALIRGWRPTRPQSRGGQAWQTQKHGPCRTFSHQTATAQPPPRPASALCLAQVTTGAAVHAVYSSPEHLQSAFCTACGLGIQAPVHRIDYEGQEQSICASTTRAGTRSRSCHSIKEFHQRVDTISFLQLLRSLPPGRDAHNATIAKATGSHLS